MPASSRAIPIKKMIEAVRNEPAMPRWWGRNQSGMQAFEQLDAGQQALAEAEWRHALRDALVHAERLASSEINLHKQLVNRILEPFSWITVIITATEWANFFTQRTHEDAQPELKHIAEMMLHAFRGSTPRPVGLGEWHTPLIQADEEASLSLERRLQISVARCARVSYLSHAGVRDHDKDVELYERLVGRRGERPLVAVRARRDAARRRTTRGPATFAAGSSSASAFRRSTRTRFRTRRRRSRAERGAPAAPRAAVQPGGVRSARPRPQARTRLDVRIDALTRHDLLARSAAGARRSRPATARARDRRPDARRVGGWALAQILAFWWLWRSGAAARLRDAMRRRTRSRRAQRAVFGAAIGALAPLAALPFALLSYRVGFNAGVTDERLPQWFADYLVRIALDAAVGAIVVTGVLALVDRLRGRWYLVLMALFYAGGLAGVMLFPLLPFGPAEKTTPREVAAMGAREARAEGVPRAPVIVVATSRHSNAMATHVVGIGPTARVLLGDLTLVHLEPPELRFVMAHAFARVRGGAMLRQTLLATTLFVLSAAVAVFFSDRVGFRRDDDALSRLALVATFLGLVLIVAYPVYNAYVRRLTSEADARALAVTGDRAEAVRSMVRYADDDLLALCDRRSVRWYFDEQPPLGARIAAIAGTADSCRAPEGAPAAAGSP